MFVTEGLQSSGIQGNGKTSDYEADQGGVSCSTESNCQKKEGPLQSPYDPHRLESPSSR